MAQQIIIDSGPRQREFEANQNRINVVSQGIEQLGSTASQFLMAYQQKVQQDKEKRLAAMTMIGTRTGFNNLGPAFMNEYEGLIGGTPKNPILPRDASGNAFMPPSLEEQHKQDIYNMFKDDPEKLKTVKLQMEGLVAPSMDPAKQHIEQEKVDVQRERAGVDAWFKKQRIGIEAVHAATAAAKVNKEDGPSGIIIDPKTKQPRPIEPGEISLTYRQLKGLNTAGVITTRQLANQSRQLLDQQRQYKLDHPKDPFDAAGAAAYNALMKTPVAKRTPEMIAMGVTWAQANFDQDQLEQIFKDMQVPNPDARFYESGTMPMEIPKSTKGQKKGSTTTTTTPGPNATSTTISGTHVPLPPTDPHYITDKALYPEAY